MLLLRKRPESPSAHPDMAELNAAQLKELLGGAYGKIDVLFFDIKREEPAALKELAWNLQPHIVITRGELATPEQGLPDGPIPRPWEACYTMGQAWGYRPTNEKYKSARQIIELLVEIRARGGNLLLNVGPTAEGDLPPEMTGRLQEIALWNFCNREVIAGAIPFAVSRQDNIWFTASKDGSEVYAVVTGDPWKWGQWYTVVLKGFRATSDAEIELLGQSGKLQEYHPAVDPRTRWIQAGDELRITAMRASRIYNSRDWPNPPVIRMRGVSYQGIGD